MSFIGGNIHFMKTIKFSLLFILILYSNILISQNFLKTSESSIINDQGDTIILRGMGLCGWMLQERYMIQT